MKINILPDNSKKNRAPEPAPVFKPYYTGSSKTLAFLGNNLLYLISFLFPVIVLFTLMAVNGFAPFGDKNLFILDGSVYNLPHFATFVEQLHSGNFSFFMEGGVLGKEYFSTIVFYLTSPLHLLLCFFSQKTAIVLLAVVTVLQIGFAGFAMTFYLTHRLQGYRYSKYDYSVLLFSFAFSLSGYFLVQYNDFMYLDCVVLFPLLFLALEHLLYKDTYKYFYGLLAFCFFCNFYMAAIIFVLLFFYVLTRKKGDFTNSVAKCIKYLFTGIFAALTSAVTVIPGFYSLYQTQIKTSSAPDFSFVTDWLSFYGSFMPKNFGSYVTVASYGNNVYCGLLAILLVCFYFTNKKINIHNRLRNGIFLCLLCFLANITSFQYVIRLFTMPETSFNAFSFFLPFFILIFSADTFYDLRSFAVYKKIAALILPFILMIVSSFLSAYYSSSISISFALIMFICYILIFTFYFMGSVQRNSLKAVLLLTLGIELILNAQQNFANLSVDADTVSNSLVTISASPKSYCQNPFTIETDDSISLPNAFYLDNNFSYTDAQYATEFEQQNVIARSLGATKDLFTSANFKVSVKDVKDIESFISSNNILSIRITPNTAKAKNARNICYLEITPSQDGYLYLHTNELEKIGHVKKGTPISYKLTFTTVTNGWANYWIYGAYLDKEVLNNLIQKYEATNFSIDHNHLFSYTISLADFKSSYLLLNMPYSKFLSIYANNQKINYSRSALDTVLIKIPQNVNLISVKMHYYPVIWGLICSLFSIFLLFGIHYFKIHLAKHKLLIINPMDKCCARLSLNWFKQHYILLSSFFIPFFTLIFCCIINGYSPFGPNNMYKGDGLALALPTMYQAKAQLEHNNLLFSWFSGGGTNFYYGFPSAFLYYWLKLIDYSSILPVFTLIVIISISLCGPSLYYYLTSRMNGQKFYPQDYRILIFTNAYSLCAYMINFRNNISWTPIFFLLPLILAALDKLMYRGKTAAYCIFLAMTMILNTNIAFFVCIYLVFAFFTYHFDSFTDFIKKGIRFAFSSLLSAGLSFFTVYDTYLLFQHSAYDSADSVFPNIMSFYQSYWDSLKQLFIFSDPVAVTELNGAINLYCGVLFIILLLLVLFLKKTYANVIKLILLAVILFSSNNEFMSYFWNGMHYQSKVPNRYSFLAIFIMIDLASELIFNYKKIKKHHLIAALFFSLLLTINIILFSSNNILSITNIASLCLLLCYGTIFIFIVYKPQKKALLFKIMNVILIFELISNVVYIYSNEEFIEGNVYNEYDNATKYYKDFLCMDPCQERITYLGTVLINQNMISSVNTMNQFNSFLSQYQFTLGHAFGYATSPNSIDNTCNLTPFTNALTNTQYIIVDQYTYTANIDFDHYTPVACLDNNIILKNNNALNIGFYIPQKTIFNIIMANVLFAEDYANKIASGFTPNNIFTDLTQVDMSHNSDNNIATTHVYHNDSAELRQTLCVTPTKSGSYYFRSSEFYYLGHLDAGKTYSFNLPCIDENGFGYLSIFHEDAFEEFYEGASKYTMDVSEFEDTSVRGTITLPEEGYIYLSIPYERGWSATIDGKGATIETAPEGFSMIKASAGTHEVHLTFRPYGLTVCIVGTLIAWIIFLFTILFERRHNKRMLLKAAEADTTFPPAHLRSHQQAAESHCELPQACSSAPQAPQEGSLPGTACYTDTLSDRSGGQAPDSIADTSAASEMKTQG